VEADQEAGHGRPGTGSTFSALADRGLVSVQSHRVNVCGQGVPHVRMSPKGRQLARSWTGVKAYKAPRAGTLKEWHWRALAKAYAAGDEGLEGEYGVCGRIGERTCLSVGSTGVLSEPLLVGHLTGSSPLIHELETSADWFRVHAPDPLSGWRRW
jgi:hypothetical protein